MIQLILEVGQKGVEYVDRTDPALESRAREMELELQPKFGDHRPSSFGMHRSPFWILGFCFWANKVIAFQNVPCT